MTINEILIAGFVICLCMFIFGSILEKKDKSTNLWGRMVWVSYILGLVLLNIYIRHNDL